MLKRNYFPRRARRSIWGTTGCQPDLGAGEDHGAIHCECAHWTCEGQPGDQAQPAWVHERQVLLD